MELGFAKTLDPVSAFSDIVNDYIDLTDIFAINQNNVKDDPFEYNDSSMIVENLLSNSESNKHEIQLTINSFMSRHLKECLVHIDHGERKQFACKLGNVVEFLKVIIRENLSTCQEINQMLTSSTYVSSLPLQAVLELYKLRVLSFEHFLNKARNTKKAHTILEDVLARIQDSTLHDLSEEIVKMVISSLIVVCYEFPKTEYSELVFFSQNMLRQISQSIISKILDRSPLQSFTTESELTDIVPSKSLRLENKENFMNIYNFSLEDSLSQQTIEQFLADHLTIILTYDTKILLTEAIQMQDKWRSMNSNKIISSFFESIVSGLGIELTLRTLDDVVTNSELNWGCVLSLLATLLTSSSNAASKVRELINRYLRNGCENCESEHLILGFLFARHACQEGRHIFPPYSQWFGSTFGSENSSPANSKQSFIFLMEFLTELVPHDNVTFLRAQVNQSIFVPRGCQQLYQDYQQLARTKLQDFQQTIVDFEFKSSGEKNAQMAEMESMIDDFYHSGKIPVPIMEASIFRRPYFLNTVLPILLMPRILPTNPDSRMDLIERLLSTGKIPKEIHSSYLKKCKEKDPQHATSVMGSVEKDQLTTLRESLKKLPDSIQTEDCLSGEEPHLLKIMSKISKNIENLFPSLSTPPYIVLEGEKYIADSLPQMVLSELQTSIFNLWQSHSCKMSKKDYNGDGCGRPPLILYLSHLVKLLGTTASLQVSFWVSLMYKLSNAQPTDKDSILQLQLSGFILSEMNEASFLPMMKPFGVLVPAKTYIIECLPLSGANEIWASCCLLNSWLESSLAHFAAIPEQLEDTYCLFVSRMASLECHNGTVGTLLHREATMPRVPISIPFCCSLFFKEFFKPRKPKVRKWISFEMTADWGNLNPTYHRIYHLQDWFNYFFSSSSEDPFLEAFWAVMEEGTYQKKCCEVIVLLQTLSRNLPKDFSLLLHFKKEYKGEQDSSLLQRFMCLSCCLPPSLFLNADAIYEQVAPFKELVIDLLEHKKSLFLDLNETRYLLESLVCAVEATSYSVHFANSFASLADSAIVHYKSLEFMWHRYSCALKDLNVIKNAYKNMMEFNQEDTSSSSLSTNHSALIKVIYFQDLLNQISIKKILRKYLPFIKNKLLLCAMFRYLSIYLGTYQLLGSLSPLPEEKELLADTMPLKTLSFATSILQFLISIAYPLDKFLNDEEWFEGYPSSFRYLYHLGSMRVTFSTIKCRLFEAENVERTAWVLSTSLHFNNCICECFDNGIVLKNALAGAPSQIEYLTEVHRILISFVNEASIKSLLRIPQFILTKSGKEISALVAHRLKNNP